MSSQLTLDTTPQNAIPGTLTSPATKLVYLYLQTRENRTITDLTEDLGLQKISLYPILQSLESKGLVHRDGEYVATAA
ncbi:Sugar-specific transcriptional regulator TrmB [Halogranum amylolyticum]|uniref:Sugar-specific transcriptional regulator TrmB n=1 Tax=Halogranum amylolyticum TaxID=660520 RepID=A0A1H8PSX3_9EURY|nr:helix-turn-helix domain-containing protein [Halogranum amylolyticum]SEO45050.1 Sugar-specific transcriptional regulator TrmB [Halogranum amylolyticum]